MRISSSLRSFRPHASLLLGVVGIVSLFAVSLISTTAASAVAKPQVGMANMVAVIHGPTVVRRNSSLNDSTSDNWSGYNLGYLSTSTLYTSMSGTWTVPTARQETSGQAEHGATWIGIGGGCLNTSCTETDNTLIQAGTEQDVSKAGKAKYSAWYELIPESSVTESMTVKPGDLIHCSITETSSGEWSIVLSDATNGQSFSENTAYSSSELTAEWIVETPVVVSTKGTGVANLPNLGDVRFSHAEVNGASAGLVSAKRSSWSTRPINRSPLLQTRTPKATASSTAPTPLPARSDCLSVRWSCYSGRPGGMSSAMRFRFEVRTPTNGLCNRSRRPTTRRPGTRSSPPRRSTRHGI